MSKHKNYILHILEQGYLNHEWALLHLLAHLSEDEAQKFCRGHALHDCSPPLWETTSERTVEDAISDLYDRKMAELDEWLDDDKEENNHG
jgi:hypothetical protein